MTGDELLAELLRIGEVESHKHIWQDGEYKGCTVTYANPLMPELKTVFRPYIPLTISSVSQDGTIVSEPWPKLTRAYFLQRGLSVPPGEDT